MSPSFSSERPRSAGDDRPVLPGKPERPAHLPPDVICVRVTQWPEDELVKLTIRFAPPHGGDAAAFCEPDGMAYDVSYATWLEFVGQTVALNEVRAAERRRRAARG